MKNHEPTMRDKLARASLFEGLDDDQWASLEPLFVEHSYPPGATVISEGDTDRKLYVLLEGRAQVLKQTSDREGMHQLRVLGQGEVVGEMKLAEFRPSSASIVALDTLRVVSLDIDRLASANLLGIRARINENLAKLLAGRLRHNSEIAVDVMQSELAQSRARESAGKFMVNVFAIVSAYTLLVAALNMASPTSRPSQTVVSALGIVVATVPIWRMLKRSPYPLSSYGITLQRWRPVLVQALLYTLPLLLLLTLIKWAWIKLDPGLGAEPLFNYRAIFEPGEPFNLGFYLFAMVIYALLSPVQELFNRSGMQASLEKILPTRPGRMNWTAIFLSNLFFAASHTYIGLPFALGAFLPGLFWGWLFGKQRSLIGVSFSHAVLGVFSLFILGMQPIIGGR